MSEEKRENSVQLNGMGTGYVSLIMIFVAICLTALAALSFSAAGMNESLRDRNRSNTAAFYDAERSANRILMQVDEAALEAAQSGLFSTFADSAALIEGTAVAPCPEGYTVTWSCPVTGKLDLMCAVTVYSDPGMHGGARYNVDKWETVPAGTAADAPLNVWNGEF